MVGDFHDLQFADNTVDVVFTNSLDHAFDLSRILAEARRVLTPGGLLICEVGLGVDAGSDPGPFESLSWANVDDILQQITSQEFQLEHRSRFDTPWHGEHLVLRNSST
jgi:ubiquinone/menaquinone biosynthesis C-methylase UbiE